MFVYEKQHDPKYKYTLLEPYEISTPIRPGEDIDTKYVDLKTDGRLILAKEYSWDGATGIPDFKFVMRAALVHDAFYQLLREQQLKFDYRDPADHLFCQMCREDGASPVFCWFAHRVLRAFGWYFARKKQSPS